LAARFNAHTPQTDAQLADHEQHITNLQQAA
jgi:hypothetical protein